MKIEDWKMHNVICLVLFFLVSIFLVLNLYITGEQFNQFNYVFIEISFLGYVIISIVLMELLYWGLPSTFFEDCELNGKTIGSKFLCLGMSISSVPCFIALNTLFKIVFENLMKLLKGVGIIIVLSIFIYVFYYLNTIKWRLED